MPHISFLLSEFRRIRQIRPSIGLRVTRLVLALFLCSIPTPLNPRWVVALRWSAGEPFDAKQWTFETGFLRNFEAQYYAGNSPRNFEVSPDGLKLIGRVERISNAAYRAESTDWRKSKMETKYTSASLVTVQSWQNVKVEIIASARGGKGAWPAIWLRGQNAQGFGEIDLMEHLGREPEKIHATVHRGASLDNLKVTTSERDIRGFQGADITYSAEVSPLTIVVAVNGSPMLSIDRNDASRTFAPLQQPFSLVMNLALGGTWSGPIDESALPAIFTIKSISIWSMEPDAATELTSK